MHLFHAERVTGYFATQRFDRDGDNRYHMHTASGLLHSDFRIPSLDYADLVALTTMIAGKASVEQLYRLAVFNVLSHNRDDHAKNFSYLMNKHGQWTLSPAYDLTFPSGPSGEQSMMVMGEGRNPRQSHILALATEAGIKKNCALEIIEAVKSSLSKWETLARDYGVSCATIQLIQKKISQLGAV